MTLYIDPPIWPGHGRMWSHLVSDVSFEELHRFASGIGVPPKAFERDHYDLPRERYDDAVRAGAVEVGSKELLRRLTAAGLRRPKHRPPDTWPADGAEAWPGPGPGPGPGPAR
ncbi:DUF4031 domain-containing protein [Streptomyces benahoarensis]|uniref:DUF4031 domain-containing protein n=1 Tax=Streptomyces benahoarensis TaxID=2595054 RepID=A0A553ZGU0_9ACTN|nr:DUF4031 domain-containing protein [Streptomyces benahoarensis]TSB22884.1 DUF4031 domain-containing protein [Streptomyces benahoarensis]TSB40685.1 DUF4031 domain-containing protein [Streptomyces benahoarensis]